MKLRNFLEEPRAAELAQQGRDRLLLDKIDTTQWMIDFFEREFAVYFSLQANNQ
jgi:hypothetical protein